MERKNLETERGSDIEDVELSQPQTQYMVVDIGGEALVLLRVISSAQTWFQYILIYEANITLV